MPSSILQTTKNCLTSTVAIAVGVFSRVMPVVTPMDTTYCLYPKGTQSATLLACRFQDVALKEFNVLTQNCSATRVVDDFCYGYFKGKVSYGKVGV